MHFPHVAILAPVSLFLAVSLSAQTDCRERTIPVDVFDPKSGQIIEPNVTNFKGTYRGRPIRAVSLAAPGPAPRVLILIDTSASMKRAPYPGGPATPSASDTGLAIAAILLSRVPPDTEIGLATFGEKIGTLIEMTADHKAVSDAIDSLRQDLAQRPPKGRTALWDALSESMDMFGNPQIGDVIYLVSDGDDNSSHATLSIVATKLAGMGIRLFQMRTAETSTDPSTAPSRTVLLRASALQQVVHETGGRTSTFDIPLMESDLPKVRDALDLQLRLILNFSRLNLEFSETIPKPQGQYFDLTYLHGPKEKDVELLYPRKLMACQ